MSSEVQSILATDTLFRGCHTTVQWLIPYFHISLSTDEVVDGKDGQAWETLREIGYEKGDVMTVGDFSGTSRKVNTSSSTYSGQTSLGVHNIPLSDYVPSDVPVYVAIYGDLRPGTDETASLTYDDTKDSVTGFPTISASGSEKVWSGWQQVTVDRTPSVSNIIPQVKTEPATNSSEIYDVSFHVGLQL